MTNLSRKKFALLLADNFDENEFWHQLAWLKQIESEVIIVGEAEGKVYKGKGGMTAIATTGITELNPDDIDGILVPGGFGPTYLRRSGDLVRAMHDQGKPVGFIYRGAWMPASCGILKGKRTGSIKIKLAHATLD